MQTKLSLNAQNKSSKTTVTGNIPDIPPRITISKLPAAAKEEWKYLLFYPVYLISFFALELFGENRAFHSIHCALDDMIQFNSSWVIPYLLWHVLMIFLTCYLLLRDRDALHRMIKFFAVTYVMVFAIYIIYPSAQNFRPVTADNSGFLNWICSIIYSADTPTNICPSMHVIGCAGLLIGCWNTRPFNRVLPRIAWIAVTVLIALSTVFMRQHSFMDLICAIPVIAAGLLTLTEMKPSQIACSCLFGDIVVLGILYRDQLTAENIRNLSPSAVFLAVCFLLLLFAAKSLTVVLPSAPLFIASGMIFSLPLALGVNIAGTVVMISLPYLLGRFSGSGINCPPDRKESDNADSAPSRIAHHGLELLEKVRNKGEFMYAFYLRSFKLLNYDLGSTYCGAIRMKYIPYILGSLTAILPEIIIYPIIGNGMFSDDSLPMIIGIVIELVLTVASAAAVIHLSNPSWLIHIKELVHKASSAAASIRINLPLRITRIREHIRTRFIS